MNANPGAKRVHRPRGERRPVSGMFLTDRDHKVLRDVFLQRAVTRKQLMALGHYGSVTVANERLRLLFDHGYLQRSSIATDLGTCELIYTLGREATSHLVRQLGIDRPEVMRAVETEAPLAIGHALAVTDARIAFTRIHLPNIAVEWLAEPQVRHEYLHSGVRHVLKPDGAVLVSHGDSRMIAFLEVDRGNVSLPQFTRCCESYRRYKQLRLPSEVYGVSAATMLCVVHAGDRRLGHLLAVSKHVGLPAFFASADLLFEHGPYEPIWRCSERPNLTRFLLEVS